MRGKVVNKHARWNLTFGDMNQDPDYFIGKGRIIKFENIPDLNKIRTVMPNYLDDKSKDLVAELNMYYDLKKYGIGFHGDTERKIVIYARLGANLPLHYQWYLRNNPIGNRMILNIDGGDIYIMSEKEVGSDWKKSSILTLRHAAGCNKYVKLMFGAHPSKPYLVNSVPIWSDQIFVDPYHSSQYPKLDHSPRLQLGWCLL